MCRINADWIISCLRSSVKKLVEIWWLTTQRALDNETIDDRATEQCSLQSQVWFLCQTAAGRGPGSHCQQQFSLASPVRHLTREHHLNWEKKKNLIRSLIFTVTVLAHIVNSWIMAGNSIPLLCPRSLVYLLPQRSSTQKGLKNYFAMRTAASLFLQ